MTGAAWPADYRRRYLVGSDMAASMGRVDVTALLDAVELLPAARRVSPVRGLDRVVVIAGIEVAQTGIDDEAALRRAWRERHQGGATPLLLLSAAGGGNGTAKALGPSDAGGPLRTLDVAALQSLLLRIAGLPRLRAVRELAAELDRLDQSGIPGVKISELLTRHTLDVRLRGDAEAWAGLRVAATPSRRPLTGSGRCRRWATSSSRYRSTAGSPATTAAPSSSCTRSRTPATSHGWTPTAGRPRACC